MEYIKLTPVTQKISKFQTYQLGTSKNSTIDIKLIPMNYQQYLLLTCIKGKDPDPSRHEKSDEGL